jgi:hypothetical protein
VTGAETTATTSTSWQRWLLDRTIGSSDRDPRHEVAAVSARRFLSLLDDDHLELARKVSWIERATFAIPTHERTRPNVRACVKELCELGVALSRALAAIHDERAYPLLHHGSALIRYLHGVYDWLEDVLEAFEDMARAAREERILPLFRYRRFGRTFTDVDPLAATIQSDVRRLGIASRGAGDRRLGEAMEELFWAASWLHLSLTRRFQ